MKTHRRLARTLAFLTLFELEIRPDRTLDEALSDRNATMEEEMGEAVGSSALEFAAHLVRGALENRPEIDQRIGEAAPAFPVAQLPQTDRAALELAVFELFHEKRSPVKVVINEAVELAKTFGGENSGRFVNGVLGTIAEDLPPHRVEARASGTRRNHGDT